MQYVMEYHNSSSQTSGHILLITEFVLRPHGHNDKRYVKVYHHTGISTCTKMKVAVNIDKVLIVTNSRSLLILHCFSHLDWHQPIKSRDNFDCVHSVRPNVVAKIHQHLLYLNNFDFSIHPQHALHFSAFYQIFCWSSVEFVVMYSVILRIDYIRATQPREVVYYHAGNDENKKLN